MSRNLLSEVQRYCRRAKISPATLAVRALNNSRFFDRLERNIERQREAERKVRAYMAENPPDKASEGEAA